MPNVTSINGVRREKDDRLSFLIEEPDREPRWIMESQMPSEDIENFLNNLKSRVEFLSRNMGKGFHAKRTAALKPSQSVKKIKSLNIVQKQKQKTLKDKAEDNQNNSLPEEVEEKEKESGLKLNYKRPSFRKSSLDYISGEESGMETERTCGNDTEPEEFMQFVAKMKKTKKTIRFNPIGKRYPLIAVEIPVIKGFKLNPLPKSKTPSIMSSSEEEEKEKPQLTAFSSTEIEHALASSFDIPKTIPSLPVAENIQISDIFEIAATSSSDIEKEDGAAPLPPPFSPVKNYESDFAVTPNPQGSPTTSDGENLKRRAKRSNIVFFD